MDKQTIQRTAALGQAVNLAVGHVGEMAGAAIAGASQAAGCPVGHTVGKALRAAGKAWADMAVQVANRDSARLTRKG